jgi:hypothetical protein
MTQTGAYEAALDYYRYGYNSPTVDGFLSLQDLATSPTRKNVTTQFEDFSTYYSSDDYANEKLLDIFDRVDEFDTASTDQITELVAGTLTGAIMYMAVLDKAFGAISKCREGGGSVTTDTAVSLLDQAVAFFVGSIEGSNDGGKDGGQLFYRLAKDRCVDFGVCEGGNAMVNVAIIEAFMKASVELTYNQCDDAKITLLENITPALLVPLIQGTLYYAVVNSKASVNSRDGSLGAGYASAFSILPLVAASDPGSALTIRENTQFSIVDDLVPDGANGVFEAVHNAVASMTSPLVKSQCSAIGRFANDTSYIDVCADVDTLTTAAPAGPSGPTDGSPAPNFSSAPSSPPAAPTTPGLGRYNFQNNVVGVAKLAFDVRDMQQGSKQEANRTYMEGGNAVTGTGDRIVSLAALSRTAAVDMDQDPIFNLFRWALLNESVFESIPSDDPLDSAYADIVVRKALAIAGDVALAAETAVVMSVWMEICHELTNAIFFSSKQNSQQAVLSVDRAVALWIGEGVDPSTFEGGYLMYTIAQQGEQFFGLPSGEAQVNTVIIDLFNEFQRLAQQSTDDDTSFLTMKVVLADILRMMTIPLLQHLFYYIDTNDDNRMKLYALAVVPQAIGCGASDFVDLRDALLSDAPSIGASIDENFFVGLRRFQRCIRVSCADLMGNSSPTGTLLDLVEKGCIDIDTSNTTIAGFLPKYDVIEMSRLDLDILQIGIFMETRAYEAAMDYYLNGFNSRGTQQPLSLGDLATSEGRSLVPQYGTFSSYFKEKDYADVTVLNAINTANEFEGASRDQAAEAVTRALQCLVSYMAVLEKLYGAVDLCRNGTAAVKRWEEGVALFVGSLEGTESGGNGAWDGTTLFSLAKETCEGFGTCEGNGDASINQDILAVLSDGRELLQVDDCEGALLVIEDEILSDLPVSLVQGVLFYATETAGLETGSDAYELASAYVLARSVLPLVDAVNKTSSRTISDNTAFSLTSQPVPDGVDSVYDAMMFVMTGMDVSCDDIGTFGERDVCDAAVVRPVSDTPTNLGDGIYTTTTYVDDRAKIAVDLVEIQDALERGAIELAQAIYRDGENSNVYDDDGIEVGKRSLQGFSTLGSLEMRQEPLFNIYRHSFQDENGQYLGADARLYGDSIVNQSFAINDQAKTLASEAMLVINLWMFLVHQLFETLDNCKNKVVADIDGVHSIDEAVAYWIGDGQIAGDGDRGHLFYALAERMGDKFQMNVNGQSRTNLNILRLFNEAKIELSLADACSTNPDTYPRLREIVYRILSQMIIPLMQSLIHNLRVNDPSRVKLYAQAVAPLTAACNPDLFEYLRQKLIDGTYNVIEVDDIVERLRTAFECLGFLCADVGQHISETDNVCIDKPATTPFAGYVPNNDVREYAQIDLDVLEARILMDMEAYDAVEDMYTYGKHATVDGVNGPKMLSLGHIATSSDRSVVPQFDAFVRFYQDNKYADTIIRTALDKTKLPRASKEQRKEIVIETMQYLVVYMGAMQAMYDAVSGCESGDASRMIGAREAWDRVAALLIGSLEGGNDGGNRNGQSLYALAKARCTAFNTCGAEGFSEVNEELLSLLYTGRGEVEANSCSALLRTVSSIESLSLVPLIQSTLLLSVVNAKLAVAPTDASFAQGYVFSRAVLPLVQSVDGDAADVINRNMDFQFDSKPVGDGPIAVFDAFAKVYADMDVDCEKVGSVEGFDSCTGVYTSSSAASSGGAIAGIVFAVLAIVCVFVYISYRRLKKRKDCEQAPEFRRSTKGVMNHDSDILGGHLNDASIIDGDEAFVRRLQVEADSLSMT